ncbi:poly(A)-specific ribonuclease PARN-like isoform X2 [Pectinophora gossypiella]|uniref:poly(A)-specific ribonuclease PARN-like isoform X2 n=1 Tax=Pectinophora gossypiella TaxID=13191 RepID=UPI00214E7BCF|nr:poly(A)-specific ribonuclease PARN-like isoform X2 [Pectinophora gossypiella]
MEVTRKNFKDTLPLVAESIDKADFLVIDAEFTGLINGRDVTLFSTPEEYYLTVLKGCSDFLLIQFGLCAFYWDQEENHYMNDAYNFYLFPRGRPGPEKMFLCQSSSLDFLSAQGFDFNKLIKEGISYMSEPDETRIREFLHEKQKSYNRESKITIPDENKEQIEDICAKVRKFVDEKKDNEMEVDRCNAFIRRLLFQELGSRFKNEIVVETKVLENKNRILKVTRVTSESDRRNHDMMKVEREWEEFEEAVGFARVARMISMSEKLVIGHNMLLDLVHTLNHFFQPLPLDYKTFKEFAHCMFPKLLDTKYMSSLSPFKEKVNSSVLPHLLTSLSEPPFSLPKAESKEGRGYNRAEDKQHEAGYDAYVTGLCFLAMHNHLASMRGEPLGRANSDAPWLKPILNKVYLAKTAHQDSPYMNFTGADPNPPRDHVFHLTFPKEWTRNDISQLFSPFGAIIVQFIDDTSAMVALQRREQARDVTRLLAGHARASILPFARYKSSIKANNKDQGDFKRDFATIPNAYAPEYISRARAASSALRSSPEKVSRPRANSLSSSPIKPAPPARKRTSSGVFQVDDAEPPKKKVELTRSNSDITRKKPEVAPNGRRKTDSDASKGKEKEKESEKVPEKRIVEKFDSEAKSNCVSAFKESDSWD